ncbi:hypothetical protein AB7303_20425 [Providencia rettgeri]|uniref:Uncharacterized protein n=2 Tax=Providencia rettgeri TaxID=587 RepID=A0A379FTF6_PRORE|nr:Uncharacterised protein [Providencia rettgeri]
MDKLITTDASQLIDTMHRVKAFLVAAQFLNRDSSERHIANELICQAEDEIERCLGGGVMLNIDKFDAVQDEINLLIDDVRKTNFKTRRERRLIEISTLLNHIKLNVLSNNESIDVENLHYWLHGVQVIVSLEVYDIETGK